MFEELKEKARLLHAELDGYANNIINFASGLSCHLQAFSY